ncbi:MAG: aspartate kinase [Candidatus Gastranaerophilales bacterium]|nr:aspartate kinase [Candidatus Gastranaerophilales bacterium]
MGIIVQKFGGTSVADPQKIHNVARAALREQKNGNNVVVVVSAMGHTTDYLVSLAKEVTPTPSPREMDMLLSTGEQVSIALLAMAIQAEGGKAISMNASQVGIITESVHGMARILDVKTEKIKGHLKKGKIVVIAGFQGITPDFEITTLGRGGSDTSAVAIAAALEADRCDIYTDVDGVYTADPRIVPTVQRLEQISYEEMLELARVGANVLHPRSVETAKQCNVLMRVRSSFNLDNLGTLILGVDDMEIYKPVAGTAADTSQVRIVLTNVTDTPGYAAKLFGRLAENNISVDMIIQSYARTNGLNDIAFTVNKDDKDRAIELCRQIRDELKTGDILVDEQIAKVSIVGAGMVDRPGIAAAMFRSLADVGINIKMISTSEIKISCLVDKGNEKLAIKTLCKEFHLDSEEAAVVNGDLPPGETK